MEFIDFSELQFLNHITFRQVSNFTHNQWDLTHILFRHSRLESPVDVLINLPSHLGHQLPRLRIVFELEFRPDA